MGKSESPTTLSGRSSLARDPRELDAVRLAQMLKDALRKSPDCAAGRNDFCWATL